MTSITIDRRFCGPPSSGNGGYVAGALAAHLPDGTSGPLSSTGAVTVTLRQPPPLDTALLVAPAGDGVRLTFGGAVVAEAVPATIELEPVEPVTMAVAAQAEAQYAGLSTHPFPTCFVCGVERSAPDGLGLHPGPVPGADSVTACRWRPGPELADPARTPAEDEPRCVDARFVWAALDCPGGWTNDLLGRPMVLGRMTAAVDAVPRVGDECLVMGRLVETEGRKSFTSTTVYDGDGRVLGRAMATWFVVDPDAFR